MQNLHLIAIKYLGPTNTRGSRVKITSDRFEQSVTIPYDYSATGRIYDMASPWLLGRGFNIVGVAEIKDGYALLSDTFKALKD